MLIGIGVVVVPYLWVLCDLWTHSADPFRGAPTDYFYDLQARAMFHGHLSLPNAKLGIEGFLHDGRTYTYFGIFPSLLRMPILLLTSRFDGDLTAPSMLLAWMMTALFSSLMLWRLRVITRGRALLGRAEAASFGVLMATIMGGSVLVYLAATPFVFNEDFAWSVPLTVGSMFTLLGVMERPSTGRVWACGVLVLLANLNRTPTGYACVIGAGLVALWFAFGRGGDSNRRWSLPMFVVAIVSFGASAAVTYAKFGTPVGLPMADQVWAQVNAHRRYFLAANGGKAFSLGFLPSTLTAYLQPFGIRFSSLFPFVSTPGAPAAAIHAVLDETYPTASVPATMPLLFLLACWGVISAFRPKALVPFRLTRIVLLTGAAALTGVLLWGYIGERYLGDFMPILIVASGLGLIEIWRRFEGRTRKARGSLLGVLSVAAVYCVVVNMAIAVLPSEQFTQAQVQDFVSTEKALSPTSLADSVQHGTTLPDWAPYGQLFMVGNCSGLYFASGINERPVPGLLIDHYTWIPVEQDPAFSRQSLVHVQPAREGLHQAGDPDDLWRVQSCSGACRSWLLHGGAQEFGDLDQLARIDFAAQADFGAPRAVPAPSDHGSQSAPDRRPLVRHVLHSALHRRVRSCRGAHNPKGDGWPCPRGDGGREATLVQREPVPEPAARRLTEP